MERVRIIVKGVVQGVGFRYFAIRIAERLGITGYVKNLPEGSVEIEAEGDKTVVNAFIKEIRIGPRYSRVTDITLERLEPKFDKSFVVK
jgi:acylphosphatase